MKSFTLYRIIILNYICLGLCPFLIDHLFDIFLFGGYYYESRWLSCLLSLLFTILPTLIQIYTVKSNLKLNSDWSFIKKCYFSAKFYLPIILQFQNILE